MTTGLESAGEKQLNPTVSELIENLPSFLKKIQFLIYKSSLKSKLET